MAKITGMKPGAKYALLALLIFGGIFLVWKFVLSAPQTVGESKVMAKSDLILASEAVSAPSLSSDKKLALPKFNEPVGRGTKIIFQLFEWNAQFPFMYAIGGARTSEGSLFAKHNIDAQFVLQSDVFKTVADFEKNTADLKEDPNATPMIWAIMGNGLPAFSIMLKNLEKLGADGEYIGFYPQGRSAGEDAFWGPQEWRRDPNAARGKGVAFVEKDGDADIVVQWAKDNQVPLNFNTKVYDPNALNVIPSATYVEAGEKVISGIEEDRILVRNGKTVPDSIIKLKAEAYSSWTPVDVTVAEKKGGLARLASTAEYTSLMPNLLIVNKKWAQNHRTDIENIIRALGEAGDQVRSFPEAAQFAAEVSALNYGDKGKPAAYWLKYYKGIEEKDATGMRVPLGGSKAFNLADAANVFGLGEDRKDRFRVTYDAVVKTLQTYYPDDAEDIAPYSKVVDKSFLLSVLANSEGGGTQETQEYNDKITTEVSNKSVAIEFGNNSDVINPSSYRILDDIYSSAVIAEGLKVGIVGHTNAVGSDATNQNLSERRAQAVVAYLRKKGISAKQLDAPRGVGSSQPLPGTDPADARNRRVEIILGN